MLFWIKSGPIVWIFDLFEVLPMIFKILFFIGIIYLVIAHIDFLVLCLLIIIAITFSIQCIKILTKNNFFQKVCALILLCSNIICISTAIIVVQDKNRIINVPVVYLVFLEIDLLTKTSHTQNGTCSLKTQ